jgi:protein-L-isoaspartate O-methyltransferase
MSYFPPYQGSPIEVIGVMLRLASPKSGEVLCDIGSGKGRIAIYAAENYPSLKKIIALEIDLDLVKESERRIRALGYEDKIEVWNKDMLDTDFSGFDICTAYLSPMVMSLLEERLYSQMPRHGRFVSNMYPLDYMLPNETETVLITKRCKDGQTINVNHHIFLYKMDEVRKREPKFDIREYKKLMESLTKDNSAKIS